MRRLLQVSLLVSLFLVPLGSVLAQNTDFGELWVDGKLPFVRVEVDGKTYEDVEYEKKGKRAVVKDLLFSKLPLEVTLVPREEGYAPMVIKLERKDFKRKRNGKFYIWLAKKAVKYKKVKGKPGKTPEKPGKKPKPKPADDDL